MWHKYNRIELMFVVLANIGTLQNADKASHYLKSEDNVLFA
jgi:hypothetical protein